MPKRLLILFPSTERGGAEEYSLTLAREAIEAKWEVHAAFSGRANLQELAGEFQTAGAAFHPIEVADIDVPRLERYRKSFSHIWPTAKLLMTIRPHAVILVLCGIEYGLGSQMSCALTGVPAAVVFQLVPPDRRLPGNIQRTRKTLADTHEYVTVSGQNRISLAASLDAAVSAISVVPNGVDLAKYSDEANRDSARARLLQELHRPDDSKIILTVGRLDPQKGHDVLIAAMKPIVACFPNTHFVWVGDGPSRQDLEKSLEEKGLTGYVSFLRYRKDIPALLAAADLFVLPTRFEGQPFSLLEAMAAGTPVVVSRASGIEEIVTDRVHGLLCMPDDSGSLETGILEALNNPALMSECARQARIRTMEFSTKKMCTGVLGLAKRRNSINPERMNNFGDTKFQEITLEDLTTMLFIEILEMHATNTEAPESTGRLGAYALIANGLPTNKITSNLPDLHERAMLKLQHAPSDEEAWALVAVLAFRHGYSPALKYLREWRKFMYHGPTLIELAWLIDSANSRQHLQRLSHSHPRRASRHHARYALLRGLAGTAFAREWVRLHVLRFRNIRGVRKILARP